MNKAEFSFPSANGSIRIHGCLWEPDTPPKGILQIAHGITEHIGRYETFARYFTECGYVVAGHDHLGHGASLDPDHPLPMYFGPAGSWQYVVEDVRTAVDECRGRYPGLPCCLLGFSLGSFAARCLLGQYPALVDMAILAGTGQTGSFGLALAAAVCRKEEKKYGDTGDTPLLHKLTVENYNKHFVPCRTAVDWLFANPEAADDYLADPLAGDGFTVSAFRELLTGMKQCARHEHVKKMNRDMPVLLLSGKDDPVGDFGKGVEKVRRQLVGHGFTRVEMRLFDGMRHGLLEEKDRLAVFRCIEEFLEKGSAR